MTRINQYMSMRQSRQILGNKQEVVFKRSHMPIYIRKEGYAAQVVLVDTPIVTYTKDNTIRLCAGMYKTNTTKLRINQFINSHGYTLYQKNFRWHVWDRFLGFSTEFVEGMELGP